MSVFHHNMLIGASGQGAVATSYQISRSLRFNSADSAYLSRTPASAGNRTTWTWSGWVKRAALSATQGGLFGARDSTSSYFQLYYPSGDALRVIWYDTSQKFADTAAVFRDSSAWYHVVLAVDTTQGTAADRIKVYVNNVQQTLSGNTVSSSYSTLVNNSGSSHVIGRYAADQDTYLSAYLADIHFIDGQALTPSSFGETDTNGIWQPKAYTGTYGTNGFRLDFADNSNNTATTLGKDTSGNGNNWTPTNLSVTAGTGNDSLVDSPTNYGTDTGAGGEVRGNYATLNPLNKGSNVTLTNGNLDTSHAGSSVHSRVVGTTGISSGKYYFEATLTTLGGQWPAVGVAFAKTTDMATYVGAETGTFGYYGGGGVNGGGAGRTYSTYTTNDVIGVAIDMDNNRLTFYKNGSNAVTSGTTYENLTAGEVYVPAVSGYGSSAAWVLNAGARPFAYTAPSGYKALCTQNLPTPTILKGSDYFDTKLYTGNGGTQTISGLGFSPDLVWVKCRNVAYGHRLADVVRGATKLLASNGTDSESTDVNSLTAFNSDGFAVGSSVNFNESLNTYAAWCWDAGSSTVTNTNGSITSSVRANASAGFSIVTYTGNLTANGTSTVGHGLGVAPSLVITKRRDGASNWCAQHISTSSASQILFLDTTDAQYSVSTYGTLSRPTSSVFSVNYTTGLGINGQTHVAYCFAPVAGYSAFGSYTGNGSADGPFVYCGFRPKYVLWKMSSSTSHWWIIDSSRSAYNVTTNLLWPNLSDAESTANTPLDLLSNGFKLRINSGDYNTSSATYVWAAFAESPFSIARAR
jgi:hypothetical protein